MQPKIYQVKGGYEIVNSRGSLFHVVASGKKLIASACGTVGEGWHGSGRLLKHIPNSIKRLFFKLNSNGKEKT